ncbi:MAG: extracellular solute-binding protein [Litorilinea sp.]
MASLEQNQNAQTQRGRVSRRSFLKGITVSAAGMALLGVAGCAAPGAAPAAGGEGAAPSEEAVSIRWHHRLGGWEMYPQRIEAYQEATGVTVVEETFPEGSAEYGPKIVSLIAAGTVGDITWTAIGTGSYQFLVQNNGLAAIDDLVEADTSGFTLDEYFPRIVSSLRVENNLYGLPETAHGVQTCLFFNRDLIEEAGADVPTLDWTRDDLLQMAIQMTEGDQKGFLPATGDYSNTRNHTLPYGGELLSEDGTTSLLETEEVKEGLRWVHSLFTEHAAAPSPQQMAGAGLGAEQMFLARQIVSYQSGGWGLSVRNVVEDEFNWDMVLMPNGPAGNRGFHLHIDAEAVTAQSEHKQEAYEFAKYLTDAEAGVGIALQIGLATRPDAFADERVASNPHLVLLGQAASEAAEHLNPANMRKQEMQTTIKAIFDPLWLGDVQPDDAFFAQASATFQEFLDKPVD